jgi:hypothetical protein
LAQPIFDISLLRGGVFQGNQLSDQGVFWLAPEPGDFDFQCVTLFGRETTDQFSERRLWQMARPRFPAIRQVNVVCQFVSLDCVCGNRNPGRAYRLANALECHVTVLVGGGSFGDLGGSEGAEIYDATTATFNATGNMTAGINSGLTSSLLPEGKVMISGESYRGCRFDLGVCAGAAELYDPVTGTFSALSNSQSAQGHAATLLPDSTVLLSGGWVCCGATIATAAIYHPAVLVHSPVLFSLSGDGSGAGAILHASTHEVVSSSNPAIAGESLEIYGTGLIDGSVIPPQVAIGGRMAEVLFFGKASGFEGLNQVNVRVPNGVAPGPTVSVRMNYLGRPSNEVTIDVR